MENSNPMSTTKIVIGTDAKPTTRINDGGGAKSATTPSNYPAIKPGSSQATANKIWQDSYSSEKQ